ncbi:MAG: Ldh family oxidoreductase [Bacteroidales bacterium]|nr:Ldh family oxidoreductase [Bacteroidales bacterium]MCB9013784.1 Ldh family oxidoreductase [Bacteroidales bacterium]
MYSYEYLQKFTENVFSKMGCNAEEAALCADLFLSAEVRGIPSHGIIRIRDYYKLFKEKRINPGPDIRIVHETPSTAVVDADRAIGMIAAHYSMKVAIEKARQCGSGWVSTRASNHYGIAGYYAMMALEHDMIGISMTNANPLVAPLFSLSKMLGTNPIAVAIPAGKYPPFVADFATTPVANGKLTVAAKRGDDIPFGLLQDKDGNPCNDPAILGQGGSMLPLGGDYEHGSHKGYCLSAIVDIFSAVLSGANFGPFVPPFVSNLKANEKSVGEGTGHFFGAMRIDAFQPASEFKAKMDEWIETFKNASTTPGHDSVLIPGEPERLKEIEIRRDGISLINSVAVEIKGIADELGLEFEVR